MRQLSTMIPLTLEEIRRAARAALDALKARKLRNACLVGGAACAFYGMSNQVPKDVDIVVDTRLDPEAIKRLMVSWDSKFYLVQARNPRATYRILWYRLADERSCKIDILVPGVLDIPHIPRDKQMYGTVNKLALAPFLVVLLLKLQAWDHHRVDRRQYMRDKVPIDEGDIKELLELGIRNYAGRLDTQQSWLPSSFVQEMKGRVEKYVQRWPYSRAYWSTLGW